MLAIVGVFAGATDAAGNLSKELFLASVIVLGVDLAIIAVLITTSFRSSETSSGNTSKLDSILEAMQMSENAKRILFRDRELQLLRKTVQDDISRGEFHAALVLCDQMANIFGAVEEAEEMRTNVQEIIHQHHEKRILDEMQQLKKLLDKRLWVEAYQYAARLRRLFPESPLLHELEQRIADVRTEYRHNLEGRFLKSAGEEDVEKAMVLLRELDGYLTPEEARKFRDTANSVITTYRESLGARFKMAVNDHRWQDATEFGKEIVRQFPNTKMAIEVTEMLDTICVRAAEDETVT
jgi:Tfp pilus assembly protein PilF